MLGTLAKWLIILGHDVTYYRRIEDDVLVALARREGRTILTCDRKLVERRAARDHILVKSRDLKKQIRQVMTERRLSIREDRLFQRCTECNETTRLVPRESVRGEVPIYVYRTQSRFRRCPQCEKLYWRATHVSRMLETLRAS
jgi:uncharacterized protein with PIN domain